VNDAASQSSTLSQVVGTIPTVTNLGITTTTGANPQIVLVATVLNNPSVATVGSLPLPTGTVTFSYGTTVIGSATIDANGVTTLIPNLNSGTYSFVASYGGDTDHAPSSSTATLFSTTPLGFNLTVTPNPVNIPQTENATVTVTLASANGFTDTIGLGCASLPSGVNCRFAVSDPTLTADGTQIVQLIIDTNNPLGGGARAMNGPPESRRFTLAGLSLPLSLFLGMAIWGFRRRNRAFFVVLLMLLSGGAMLVSGCSGFSQSSAKPGTYVIQVTGTGTASNITHYQNVTLNITAK